MRKTLLSIALILLVAIPAFAGGTQVLTQTEYFIASQAGVLDTLGRAMVTPDSMRIAVSDSNGTELFDAWFEAADAQCNLNGDNIVFFDQWQDINGAANAAGKFNVSVTYASDGSGDVDVFSHDNFVVVAVDQALTTHYDELADALDTLQSQDGWVGQEASLTILRDTSDAILDSLASQDGWVGQEASLTILRDTSDAILDSLASQDGWVAQEGTLTDGSLILATAEWEKVWFNIDTVNVDSSDIGEWMVNNLSGAAGGLDTLSTVYLDRLTGRVKDSVWKSILATEDGVAGSFADSAQEWGPALFNVSYVTAFTTGSLGDSINNSTGMTGSWVAEAAPFDEIIQTQQIADADGLSTTTFTSAGLTEATDNYWLNQLVFFVDGPAKGQSRRISAFTQTTDSITVSPAFTNAPTVGDSFYIAALLVESPSSGGFDTLSTVFVDRLTGRIADTNWLGNFEVRDGVAGSFGDSAQGWSGTGGGLDTLSTVYLDRLTGRVKDSVWKSILATEDGVAGSFADSAQEWQGTWTAAQKDSVLNNMDDGYFTATKLASSAALEIADTVWDEILTGSTHNIVTSAGRRLRNISDARVITTGTALRGNSLGIVLAAAEAFADNILNGNLVQITGGTGFGQARHIEDYTGATDSITLHEGDEWTTTPDATSEYVITAFGGVDVVHFGDSALADLYNFDSTNVGGADGMGTVMKRAYTVSLNNRDSLQSQDGWVAQEVSLTDGSLILATAEWEKVWFDIDTVNVDSSDIGEWMVNNLAGAAGGVDSSVLSRVIGRKVWGIAAGSGSDSSTAQVRGIDVKFWEDGTVAELVTVDARNLVNVNVHGWHELSSIRDNLEEMLDDDGVGVDVDMTELSIVATTTNASAVTITGDGTGDGMQIRSGTGATGDGIDVASSATDGVGFRIIGAGTGDGLNITSGGGVTGNAVGFNAVSTLGHGLALVGNGGGEGLTSIGGITGHGAEFIGGATSGRGVNITGSGTGDGLRIRSGAGATGDGMNIASASTNGIGIRVVGTGTGEGMTVEGGATSGDGLRIEGGAPNGNGFVVIGDGSGHGFLAQNEAGTGKGIQADSGFFVQDDGGANDIVGMLEFRTIDTVHVDSSDIGEWLVNNLSGAAGGLDTLSTVFQLRLASLIADTNWLALLSARDGTAGSFGDSSQGWSGSDGGLDTLSTVFVDRLTGRNADSVWLSLLAARDGVAGSFGDSAKSWKAQTAAFDNIIVVTHVIDGGANVNGFTSLGLTGGDDYWNNNMIFMIDGNAGGQASWIYDHVGSSDSILLGHPLSAAPAIGDSFYVMGMFVDSSSGAGGGLDTLSTVFVDRLTGRNADSVWLSLLEARDGTAGSFGDSAQEWGYHASQALQSEVAGLNGINFTDGSAQINWRDFVVDSGVTFAALNTGAGFTLTGGATAGDAMNLRTTAGDGIDILAGSGGRGFITVGNGAGDGFVTRGGATGKGMQIDSGLFVQDDGGSNDVVGLLEFRTMDTVHVDSSDIGDWMTNNLSGAAGGLDTLSTVFQLRLATLIADTNWLALLEARDGVAGSFGDSAQGWGATGGAAGTGAFFDTVRVVDTSQVPDDTISNIVVLIDDFSRVRKAQINTGSTGILGVASLDNENLTFAVQGTNFFQDGGVDSILMPAADTFITLQVYTIVTTAPTPGLTQIQFFFFDGLGDIIEDVVLQYKLDAGGADYVYHMDSTKIFDPTQWFDVRSEALTGLATVNVVPNDSILIRGRQTGKTRWIFKAYNPKEKTWLLNGEDGIKLNVPASAGALQYPEDQSLFGD